MKVMRKLIPLLLALEIIMAGCSTSTVNEADTKSNPQSSPTSNATKVAIKPTELPPQTTESMPEPTVEPMSYFKKTGKTITYVKEIEDKLGIDLNKVILDTVSEIGNDNGTSYITVDKPIYSDLTGKSGGRDLIIKATAAAGRPDWNNDVVLIYTFTNNVYMLGYKTVNTEIKLETRDINSDGIREVFITSKFVSHKYSVNKLNVLKYSENKFISIFDQKLFENYAYLPYSYVNSYKLVNNKQNPGLIDINFNINTDFDEDFYNEVKDETGFRDYKKMFKDIFGSTPPKDVKQQVVFSFDGDKYVPDKKFYNYRYYFDRYFNDSNALATE